MRNRELTDAQVLRICEHAGVFFTPTTANAIRAAYREGFDADCMKTTYKEQQVLQLIPEDSHGTN